jgi:protein-disulfide isomerase
MTPASVRQAAKDMAGVADLEEKYSATIASVKSDVALGKQVGIRATPTFFINGVKFDSAIMPQYFDAAIAYELQHPPK